MLSLSKPPPPPQDFNLINSPQDAPLQLQLQPKPDTPLEPKPDTPVPLQLQPKPDTSLQLQIKPDTSLQPPDQNISGKTTEQILSDTLSAIRVPKINRDWKKCISEIEKNIDKKPSLEEYNDPGRRRNIEYYKDRLAKDLYECKINQKKKEAEDKNIEQMKRKKAQESFEKRFEEKYNLTPRSSQKQYPQQVQSETPEQAFGIEMQKTQGMVGEKEGVEEEKKMEVEKSKEGKKKKGFFQSLFGTSDEEEEEEEEEDSGSSEKKEEMIDAINMYLKSQDPSLPQSININDVKGIDNLISQYEELVENHDKLTSVFQKYKEDQRVKNVTHTSLTDEQQETIDNLTSVILKLEKKLKEYKRNAEKKYIAQGELHEETLKSSLKEKEQESREIHKYMQNILNERITTANKIIQGLSDETELSLKKPKKQRTKKKKKTGKKKK